MSPLPVKLSSATDGTSTGPREVFGRDVWEDLDHGVQRETNVVDSFYGLSQLRPTIISDLIAWKFFFSEWEHADEEWGSNFEETKLSAVDETYPEWLKRFLAPLVASNMDTASSYPFDFSPASFEMDGNLYTELFTSSEHDSLLLVRDENGVLRVFLWDSLDDPFEF